ncbi:MAG: AMP-binding protein, partial [bacterium]
MHGLMMDQPLLISSILRHAELYHSDGEIVSRTVEGPIHRDTYGGLARRARQLANALTGLGVGMGDRVATIAWNGYRHLEAYYAISGIGAVCHTINPRLFPEQLTSIVNHAQDRVLFFDINLAPLVAKMRAHWPKDLVYVAMCNRAHLPTGEGLEGVLAYED